MDAALRIEPIPPPPSLRARLLRATADPWWRGTEAIARLVDLPEDEVRAVLARARRGGWVHDVRTGLELFEFDGGPAVAEADVGIVRAAPGHHFPFHRHATRERIGVLEGRVHDGTDALVAGAVADFAVGTSHAWWAGPDGVVLVVVMDAPIGGLPKG